LVLQFLGTRGLSKSASGRRECPFYRTISGDAHETEQGNPWAIEISVFQCYIVVTK
jgi:hypothetical protein